MVNYKLLIDNEDFTEFLALPFKEQYVLDSALDNGTLTLPYTNRDTIFKPFTKVEIIKDSESVVMLVASDKMTEIVGTGKYTHELVLIEETKLLEKKVVDTNTTTQPLIHDYDIEGGSVYVESTITSPTLPSETKYYYNSQFKPLIPIDVMTLPSAKSVLEQDDTDHRYTLNNILNDLLNVYITLKDVDNNIIQTFNGGSNDYDTPFILNTPLQSQLYKIEYKVHGYTLTYTDLSNSFEFWGYNQQQPRNKKSITDVVNRLLAITETLRTNESPALVFNQEQANFYNQAKETWLINDSPNVASGLDFDIKFISKGTEYSNIKTGSANLYYDDTSMYYSVGDSWRDEAYKTIQFLERPTGTLLTWLQSNATKQSEELYYPAPEFSMTKSTLRECLDQVGGYIHSIVRLVDNTIYFDKLGGTQQTELDDDYIGHYETLDCEQYASQLDSIVSNLTNIDDVETGTIIEPYESGYKTVRAESIAVRINDENAIIETEYPIERIYKLECGWVTTTGGDIIKVGDITPYVYEKAEYDLLSSVSGTFPLSKGYAITYTQGEKNITGLMFKLLNPVSSVFNNQAIINIISQKTGMPIQDIFNVQNIAELQFRVTYFPSTTARVEQVRTDINNYSMELTSIYNQSANKVDSRAYGENLKGTIARLGNIEKFITFTKVNRLWHIKEKPTLSNNIEIDINFTSNGNAYHKFKIQANALYYNQTQVCFKLLNNWVWVNNEYRNIQFNEDLTPALLEWLEENANIKAVLPEVGSYVTLDEDDYYIATLNVENQIDHTKYTVGLSKDFNALAKYIGIKNNIRLYEVSEKQSVERYVVRHDYCVIGTPIESDFADLLTDNAKGGIVEQFIGYMYDYVPAHITMARVQGIDQDNNELTEMDLPVISLAMGNTLWFGFKYADNYSAGNQSMQGNGSGTYYRLNAPAQYTDYFGELKSLKVKMMEYTETINNRADAVSVGSSLPVATTQEDEDVVMVDTASYPLDIYKDNREQINVCYQLHFVTNDNIIIGSQLAQGSRLVGRELAQSCLLYVLPTRVNKFANILDVSQGTLVKDYTESNQINYNYTTNQVAFDNIQSTASGKSWVLVDSENRLIFGKNIAIENGDTIEMPTMTYTHKGV